MDPVTHLVAGGLAATAVLPNAPWEGMALGAAAALTPDFDFILRLLGEERFQDLHRGPTHSLLGILTLSLLTAAIASLIFGWSFPLSWLATGAGLCSHLSLDYLLHGTGIESFWPFKRSRQSANLILGLNPKVGSILCHRRNTLVCLRCMLHINILQPHTYILLAGLAGVLIFSAFRQPIAITVYIAIVIYIGIIISNRMAAHRYLYKHLGLNSDSLKLYPAHPLPHAWLGVVWQGDQAMTAIKGLGKIRPLRHNRLDDEWVQRAYQTTAGRFFAKIAKQPAMHVEHTDQETIVHLYDLSHAGLAPEELFSTQVVFDYQGKLIAEEFREKWMVGTPGPSPLRN